MKRNLKFLIVLGESVLGGCFLSSGDLFFYFFFSVVFPREKRLFCTGLNSFKYEIACKLLLSSSSVQLQQLVANQKYSSVLVPCGCISL